MVRVADISTKVICDEPAFFQTISGPTSRFVVPDGPVDSTIRASWVARLANPAGARLFDAGLTWRLYREQDDFIFTCLSPVLGPDPYRLARLNASFTDGTIWLNRATVPRDAVLAPLDFPLDELLMINLLARGRGVEVHACGVIDQDGAGYLFPGQSGAGKSTIARLWRDQHATVLSDDRLILRLRDGRVWMYGTPWHGEDEFAAPASAPLSFIFFLAQGMPHQSRKMSGASAAARLFACSFPPFYDAAGLDFTLALLGDIMERVPASELTFVPDPTVVSFVRSLT